jgi:hypothetical protein
VLSLWSIERRADVQRHKALRGSITLSFLALLVIDGELEMLKRIQELHSDALGVDPLAARLNAEASTGRSGAGIDVALTPPPKAVKDAVDLATSQQTRAR